MQNAAVFSHVSVWPAALPDVRPGERGADASPQPDGAEDTFEVAFDLAASPAMSTHALAVPPAASALSAAAAPGPAGLVQDGLMEVAPAGSDRATDTVPATFMVALPLAEAAEPVAARSGEPAVLVAGKGNASGQDDAPRPADGLPVAKDALLSPLAPDDPNGSGALTILPDAKADQIRPSTDQPSPNKARVHGPRAERPPAWPEFGAPVGAAGPLAGPAVLALPVFVAAAPVPDPQTAGPWAQSQGQGIQKDTASVPPVEPLNSDGSALPKASVPLSGVPAPGPMVADAAPVPVLQDPGSLSASTQPTAVPFDAEGRLPTALLPPGASELRFRVLAYPQTPGEALRTGLPWLPEQVAGKPLPVVAPPDGDAMPGRAAGDLPSGGGGRGFLPGRATLLPAQGLAPALLAQLPAPDTQNLSVRVGAPDPGAVVAVDAAPAMARLAGRQDVGVLRASDGLTSAVNILAPDPSAPVASGTLTDSAHAAGAPVSPSAALSVAPVTPTVGGGNAAATSPAALTPQAAPAVLTGAPDQAGPRPALLPESAEDRPPDKAEGREAAARAAPEPAPLRSVAGVPSAGSAADLPMPASAGGYAADVAPFLPDPMVEGLALSGAIPARADAGASAFGSGPLTTSLAAPVLQQVSAAVSGTLSGPLSGPVAPITELRLSPEELGSVRIEVTTDGDKVAMVVAAERQDTQDLLRRHADRLMAELREAGFARLDLSFGAWSGPPGDERASDLPLPPPVLDGPSDIQLALAPSGPTASRAAVAAGLYLRI